MEGGEQPARLGNSERWEFRGKDTSGSVLTLLRTLPILLISGTGVDITVKPRSGQKEALKTHVGSISYSDHQPLISHTTPEGKYFPQGFCLAVPQIKACSL